MYRVNHFAEDRLDVQHELIEQHPLGLLISHNAQNRLLADPIPFTLIREQGELGILRAHIARPNPQFAQLPDAAECLVVFQGEEAYISPNWYPTKKAEGKVVPTWNYVTVHVWGKPSVIDDPDWVRSQIDHLTKQQEASQPNPWQVDDAPANFTFALIKGIVGIEIAISEIQGKWKVSQNRPATDIAGVHTGLSAAGMSAMADRVAKHID